ncbi:hypothetical protein LTR17_014460 [Elasticomyces elasticus]|nr:hypothetical protein LTR17_014460 [Elasticomyces elasticus]
MPMNNTTSSTPDQSLTGQGNWIRWFPSFKADARADDVWELFSGDEPLLKKPARSDYIQTVRQQLTPPLEAEAAKKATGPEIARQDFKYKQSVEEYKLDLHDYEQQRERVRRANKLLHKRVDTAIQIDV